MKATSRALDLTLRHTFRISRSAVDVAENVLLAIEHAGRTGLGEAHPYDYRGEDRRRILRALDFFAEWLERQDSLVEAIAAPFRIGSRGKRNSTTDYTDSTDESESTQVLLPPSVLSVSSVVPPEIGNRKSAIGNLLACLPPEVRVSRGAMAALDIALYDLVGQMLGKPLWQLFGADPAKAPVTSFTIGIAPVPEMQAKVREAERFPILKIKVGTRDDLAILEGIRAVTDKPLRVDANAAWTVPEAIEKIRAIEPFGIEFIEQPIPPGDIAGLREVRRAVALPILVDESVTTADDLPPLAGAVDGINLKLMKCGGLHEAERMIHLARSLGLKVMLGCCVESSIAITAAAHLAPLVDYADLDGNLLIANDPYDGVTLDVAGRLVLPDRPGLGLLPRA